MKNLCKVCEIKYKNNNKDLPSELVIDFNNYEWVKNIPIGPINLNTKVYRAIKEITGEEAYSCKLC